MSVGEILDSLGLTPDISDVTMQELQSFRPCESREKLLEMGIELRGSPTSVIYLDPKTTRFGRIVIDAQGERNIFVLGSDLASNNSHIIVRSIGASTRLVIPRMSAPFNFLDIFFRSSHQTCFIGSMTTSVGTRIELEGAGRKLVIGDDCMLSGEVNIRNYDMHTIFDIEEGVIANSPPHDIVLQKHVWLGYRTIVTGAGSVGMGSIVGASSFVNRDVPRFSVVGGVPGKVIKTGVSWSRLVNSIEAGDLEMARRALALDRSGEEEAALEGPRDPGPPEEPLD